MSCKESFYVTPNARTVIVYDGNTGSFSAEYDSQVTGKERQTKLFLWFLYHKVIFNGEVSAELHGWACECKVNCSDGKVHLSCK